MEEIRVDDGSLQQLKEALATAGEDYRRNVTRLTNLINQIVRGDITGDPATELLSKYEAKQDVIRAIYKTIEEAEEYAGVKKSDFGSMISGLNMK